MSMEFGSATDESVFWLKCGYLLLYVSSHHSICSHVVLVIQAKLGNHTVSTFSCESTKSQTFVPEYRHIIALFMSLCKVVEVKLWLSLGSEYDIQRFASERLV